MGMVTIKADKFREDVLRECEERGVTRSYISRNILHRSDGHLYNAFHSGRIRTEDLETVCDFLCLDPGDYITNEEPRVVFVYVSHDKYELPLDMADSIIELAERLGKRPNVIYSSMTHAKHDGRWSPYRKVIIEEE